MILTNGRSGSNYLVDVINQHPALYNYGEVLGPWSKKRKLKKIFMLRTEEDYLRFILQNRPFFYLSQIFYYFKNRKLFEYKNASSVTLVGIKDFGINIQRCNLQNWLIENKELKVIHLYRENQLERYVSLVAMKNTGLVSTQSGTSTSKVLVDCHDLLRTLEIYETEMDFQFKLANALEDSRLISISYENLFMGDNRAEVVGDVFDFLGVEKIPIRDRHQRILSSEISEKVENYSELLGALKGTKFEKYLR